MPYYNHNCMNKSFIYFLLLTLAIAQKASQGTEGFYISPHGLSRQREVHDALQKIASKVTVEKTTYKHANIDYTIENTTIILGYMDSRQTINIIGDDEVKVSGGRIEVHYAFNWSKYDAGKTTKGWANGFVMTDSLNYTKGLTFGSDGHLMWELVPGNKSFTELTIFDRMRIKRMEPFNETDISALEDMLDRAITGISPGTIQHQVLEKLNSILPITLNTTLNSYILGAEINYEFDHAIKGKLTMTIVHHLYEFSITPEEGYKVIYLTEIKGWTDPVCDGMNVPSKHEIWEFYGGSQNIHLNCLYLEVVEYMQKKGWLDTKLDTTWDSNAFQFYAGDLFELINNLYIKVHPREMVSGECKASANGLNIKYGRDIARNVLSLQVHYACNAQTRDMNMRTIDVLNFTAEVKFNIYAKADKTTLDFSIRDAEIVSMEFRPVGDFYVGNINLAYFKANQVLHKLKSSKVFGTGFPTLARELPGSEVTENYTIYYDVSQKNMSKVLHFD